MGDLCYTLIFSPTVTGMRSTRLLGSPQPCAFASWFTKLKQSRTLSAVPVTLLPPCEHASHQDQCLKRGRNGTSLENWKNNHDFVRIPVVRHTLGTGTVRVRTTSILKYAKSATTLYWLVHQALYNAS